MDCEEGIRQIDKIENMRSDIIKGLDYNIKSFNDAFFNSSSEHPIAILNINVSNIFCILFNIVYLLLVIKSKDNFHGYHRVSIYSFYAVSMLYILNNDKTLSHIMNNIQICKFFPYLIIFRTIIYIYLTVFDTYEKTAYDVDKNATPFELTLTRETSATVSENPNKRMFIAAKLLSSSADLMTIILLIIIVLNYLKPVILSKQCSDIIEIFDFDIDSNNIRNKVNLNFSITDNYELNKTIFNTHPINEKILVLFDNMNLSNDNKVYFYINILWKLVGFSLIMQLYYKLRATYNIRPNPKLVC